LALLLVQQPLSSMLLFFCSVLLLSLNLFVSIPIIGLLVLYVYLGGLMILFSYFWIFHSSPATSHFNTAFIPLFLLLLSSSPVRVCSSFSTLLTSSGLLVFFASSLFLVIIIVVCVLDLSLGSFS